MPRSRSRSRGGGSGHHPVVAATAVVEVGSGGRALRLRSLARGRRRRGGGGGRVRGSRAGLALVEGRGRTSVGLTVASIGVIILPRPVAPPRLLTLGLTLRLAAARSLLRLCLLPLPFRRSELRLPLLWLQCLLRLLRARGALELQKQSRVRRCVRCFARHIFMAPVPGSSKKSEEERGSVRDKRTHRGRMRKSEGQETREQRARESEKERMGMRSQSRNQGGIHVRQVTGYRSRVKR